MEATPSGLNSTLVIVSFHMASMYCVALETGDGVWEREDRPRLSSMLRLLSRRSLGACQRYAIECLGPDRSKLSGQIHAPTDLSSAQAIALVRIIFLLLYLKCFFLVSQSNLSFLFFFLILSFFRFPLFSHFRSSLFLFPYAKSRIENMTNLTMYSCGPGSISSSAWSRFLEKAVRELMPPRKVDVSVRPFSPGRLIKPILT